MSEPSDEDLFDEDLLESPRPPLWRRALKEWVLPLVGFVVLFQLVGWLRAPSLPEQAPAFALKTPEGETVTLAGFRGRKVVLNFWATWCGPCRLEAPSFDAFASANPDVVVLGLAQDRNPGLVRSTAEQLGMHYPVLLADADTLGAYGIDTFPTTVVVDEQGRVEHAHTGLLTRPQLWWMTAW